MKPIIFTIITLLCTYGRDATAQRLRIGHRNVNQVAVLDINIAYIQPTIVQELSLQNYVNIKVTDLDISENAFNPNYYASIGITVEYQERNSPNVLKLSFLYPIVYDPSLNVYYGGTPTIEGIPKGGSGEKNPDNNFCKATNCVGCKTLKDGNGKTLGCGICIPFNDLPYDCSVTNLSGLGAARVINALGGLLKGLFVLF